MRDGYLSQDYPLITGFSAFGGGKPTAMTHIHEIYCFATLNFFYFQGKMINFDAKFHCKSVQISTVTHII
jgi:hypothetical protein